MVSLLLGHRPAAASALPTVRAREPLLHVAAAAGHVSVGAMLLEGSVGELCVDELDRFGCTALHKAVANNRLEFIQQVLLPHRASLNISDRIYNETALMKACKRGLKDVIRLLLQQDGIDIHARTRCGDTAASLCRPTVPQDLRSLLATPISPSSIAAAAPPHSKRGQTRLASPTGEMHRVHVDMKSEKYLQQLEDANATCPLKLKAVSRTMANQIIKARTAMNLTQAALAGRVAVGKQVIQRLEAAEGIPDVNIVRKVGRVLGISLITTN